ncbi:hypothetical protein PR048_027652 [Dryococelus australis]|uniref:Uncharacterized protein n=1 Tax=Dryococelus australis TaxID=614101 RepID=A0ABQ9GH28_9NEOP|nr:hypothetical protein PR048_027652 [Dryococelus australis]
MSRIVKPEILEKVSGATFRSLDLHNIENTFPSEEIDVGCFFFHEAKKFIISITEYLLDKVPIENKLIRNIQCLHPLFQHESKVAELMPIVIKSCDIDKLCDEWKLYMAEKKDEATVSAEVPSGSITRMYAYWSAIQNKEQSWRIEISFTFLSPLTLSHGQADIEQGFSMNKHFIPPSCSLLTAQTINGLHTVQSVIKLTGGVCQMPLSPMCFKYFRDASSKYKAYLEDCKKEKSELDTKSKRKDGVERLGNLKKEGKILQEAIQASHCLIGEA